MFPGKLREGDEIRVAAPSYSLSMCPDDVRKASEKNIRDLGLGVSFSKNCMEIDDFRSSSIASRVSDIHDAFSDRSVKAVVAATGGFSSNQLLRYLDYGLIRKNPKIIIGMSDITALVNAIYAKTGLVTYCGLDFFDMATAISFGYNLDYFRRCLIDEKPFRIMPSEKWTNDAWDEDQKTGMLSINSNPPMEKGAGFLSINKGEAEGTCIGGNQCTLNLLQGTEYMPSLKDSILFLEDDYEIKPHHFDRDLQSLIHLPGFEGVRGIVIGRFQKETGMTDSLLTKLIKTKKELEGIPVLANADFGHTYPTFTFPVGGRVRLSVGSVCELEIKKH